MKVIDKNGMLFGKINIIDFLVVVFIICLTPMFYFGYRIFTENAKLNDMLKAEEIGIEAECEMVKLNLETFKSITLGDTEKDNKKRVIGEIVWIGQSGPTKCKIILGQKEEYVAEDPILVNLPVKIRMKVVFLGERIYYGSQQISSEKPFCFKTDKYSAMVNLKKIGRKLLVEGVIRK